MRRTISILLALLLLFSACAWAELVSACEIALEMAKTIPEMQDVRERPLEDGRQNRAVWTDSRTQLDCSLVVYTDEGAAKDAAILQSTRKTAVRDVANCALFLNSGLGTEAIWEYRLKLAEVLGVELLRAEPDYMLNVNTRKFHLPDCSSVEQIKESNRQEYYVEYYGGRDELTVRGYDACKNCKP